MNYLKKKNIIKFIVFLTVVMVVFWSIPCNIAFGETQEEGSELQESSGSEQTETVGEMAETPTETTEDETTATEEDAVTEETEEETEETTEEITEMTTETPAEEAAVDATDIEAELLPDTNMPVITIIGENPVMVELGSVYIDAGATAIDDIDGDLTASIEVLSSVDTAVSGSYKVRYNVSDKAGNAAVEVMRIVNVVGKPTVTTDKDDYSPGDIVVVTGSGWLPGETVKLDFVILPLQMTLTYYALADSEGNIYNNEYMIFEHHLGQTVILTATGQTSSLSAMTIFTDSPKIGSVTVGNQSPVTVYPTANARFTITIRRGSGSGSFYADLSLITSLPPGCTASFGSSHIYFSSTVTSRTTTLTISTTSGSTPIGSASFTVKAEVSGTPADFATGNGTLTVGGVGSVTAGSQSPNPVYASNSATYTVTVNRGGGTGPFSVDFSITTSLPSGCTYSFNPSAVSFSSGDALKTSTLTVNTSISTPAGSTSFTIRATNSGNPNDYKNRSRTLAVATDTTTPTVTLTAYLPDPTGDNTPTYSGSAADTRTNIVDIEYRVDSGSWIDVDAFTPAKNASFTFTTTALADGLHTIYARAYDAAGNVSVAASDTLTVGTSPAITGQPSSAIKTIGESVTFSVTASGTAPLSYQWRKNGSNISGATNSSYTIPSVALSDAGSYDVVVSNAYGYVISNTATLTVNPITISLSVSPASGTYGGTIDLSATLTPAVDGKTISFTLNGTSAGSATTDASGVAELNGVSLSGIDAGSYPTGVGASFAGDSNYSASSDSDSLTVNPKALTITADNKSKIYGQANPDFTVSYVGFISGDDSSVLGGTLSFDCVAVDNSPVGNYPITPSGLTSSNYTISFIPGFLTVGPKALTITASDKIKVYGDPNPAFSVTYSGFAAGDDESDLLGTLSITTTATEASSVGTYPIAPSGLNSTNYNITFVDGTLTITTAALTVTADNTSRMYGEENPLFSGNVTGIVNSDNITATYNSPALVTDSVGTYPIIPILSDPDSKLGNYTVTIISGALTINPVPLTVTTDDASKLYGDSNPAFSVTYSGFAVGDDETDLLGALAITTTAVEASPIGTYPITPSGLSSTNYSITFADGALTVTAAQLTVTADDALRVYGNTNPLFSGTITGIVNSDNITATYDSPALNNSPAGTYPIVPILSDPDSKLGNYTVTIISGTLTITAAAATVTTGDNSDGKFEDSIVAVNDEIVNNEMLDITIAQLSTTALDDFDENLFDSTAAINDETLITTLALTLDNGAEPNIIVAGITDSGTTEVSEFTRLSPIILISGIGVMAVGLIALFIYLSRMMRLRKFIIVWFRMIR